MTDEVASGMTVTFVAQETPAVIGSTVYTKNEKFFVTDSNGALPTVVLAEGRYTVKLQTGEEFDIDVPSGSGTSNIATLIVSTSSGSDNPGAGHGSPEGVVRGSPGVDTYLDLDTDQFWVKRTGTGTTGWLRLIA